MAEEPRQPGPAPAVTLAELARACLGDADAIADLSAGTDTDLSPVLGRLLDTAPDGSARYRRTTPAQWSQAARQAGGSPGGGLLTVLTAGPDPRCQLPWETCERVLGELPEGAHALLLLPQPPAGLPVAAVAAAVSGQGCLILAVAGLAGLAGLAGHGSGHPELRTGLAVTRAADSPGLPQLNEYALASAALTGLRTRVAELADAAGIGAGPAVPAPAVTGAQAGRDRLAWALRSTQRELVAAQAELALLEDSVTVAAGRAVVAFARNPLRGGARLPREGYRLWRARRAGGARPAACTAGTAAPARGTAGGGSPDTAAGAGAALALAQDRGAAGLGDRWLSAFTAPGYPGRDGAAGGLVVTGVLTAAGCATLEPDAVVHPLLPHNADFVLEGTGADLVLIQAAALQPGSAWAYAADPAAADRGRRLAALVALARSLGKPVVLLRDSPWSPAAGLEWLADSCDAVLDGDLGVQLSRFSPLGVTADRPCGPVYAGARDPREPPALRRVLDELGAGGRGLIAIGGPVPWRSAPDRYRAHGVFLAATAAQAREQFAAGARVIGPPGAEPPLSAAIPVPDAARAAGEIKQARDAGPPGWAELAPVLREIFSEHATPARLAQLAQLTGLPPGLADVRQVAVLAQLADPAEAGQLAAGLLAQRLRPAEVAVSLPAPHPDSGQRALAERAVTAALRPLAAAGTQLRLTDRAGHAAAAAVARSPWAVPWPRGRGVSPDYLLDLACARECSRADAVGFAAGYGFGPVSRPALARRELLIPGAPDPASWPVRGLRTFTITTWESS